MPRIIAQNRIARVTIGNRRITSPGGGGGASGSAPGPFTFPPTLPVVPWFFTPPKGGLWKFVLWAAGQPSAGGRSGSYGEITKRLAPSDTVKIEVTSPYLAPPGLAQSDARLTFSDGKICIAKGGGMTNANATGFDLSLNGSDAGLPGLGTGGGTTDGIAAGAPAMLPFRGGNGQDGSGGFGVSSPGGGASGGGLCIVVFVRD